VPKDPSGHRPAILRVASTGRQWRESDNFAVTAFDQAADVIGP
jgi:hypothetical protein